MKKIVIIFLLCLTTSCSSLAVSFTPHKVKESVGNATAIAILAEQDPPKDEQLKEYLKLNAKLWLALSEFYGLTGE